MENLVSGLDAMKYNSRFLAVTLKAIYIVIPIYIFMLVVLAMASKCKLRKTWLTKVRLFLHGKLFWSFGLRLILEESLILFIVLSLTVRFSSFSLAGGVLEVYDLLLAYFLIVMMIGLCCLLLALMVWYTDRLEEENF